MTLCFNFLMEKIEVITHSPKETQKIAELFARELLTSDIQRTGALIVALEGDLGGGKTTFAQGFARGLGVREKVVSPTFIIMRHHNLRKVNFRRFVHVDAYRIGTVKELAVLGWRDIIKDKETILLVEWADRIRKALPLGSIRIRFVFVDERTRIIKISN